MDYFSFCMYMPLQALSDSHQFVIFTSIFYACSCWFPGYWRSKNGFGMDTVINFTHSYS